MMEMQRRDWRRGVVVTLGAMALTGCALGELCEEEEACASEDICAADDTACLASAAAYVEREAAMALAEDGDIAPPAPSAERAGAVVQLPYIPMTNARWCGNGKVEPPEQCDGHHIIGGIPLIYCTEECTYNWCGDGHFVEGAEECDDGNNAPGDGCGPGCWLE